MTAMLMFSTLLPFSIVVVFILYMCFWDKWSQPAKPTHSLLIKPKDKLKNPRMELAPLVFSRHELPIERVCFQPPNTVVSTSLGGRVMVWDSNSGELKHTLSRSKGVSSASSN